MYLIYYIELYNISYIFYLIFLEYMLLFIYLFTFYSFILYCTDTSSYPY